MYFTRESHSKNTLPCNEILIFKEDELTLTLVIELTLSVHLYANKQNQNIFPTLLSLLLDDLSCK